MKGTKWHKGKLQLFERSPARWAGRIALQPRLETFLMVAFNKIRPGFFRMGRINSRMSTFWSQSSHLLFLELHQTNAAVIHRRSHQTELQLHSPVFEFPAPLNLDWGNKRDAGGILRAIVRSRCTGPFGLSDHFRDRELVLHNASLGVSEVCGLDCAYLIGTPFT